MEDIEIMTMIINSYTFDQRILLNNVLLFFSLVNFCILIVVAVYVFISIFDINLSFVL